jgi:hypothetical protein
MEAVPCLNILHTLLLLEYCWNQHYIFGAMEEKKHSKYAVHETYIMKLLPL